MFEKQNHGSEAALLWGNYSDDGRNKKKIIKKLKPKKFCFFHCDWLGESSAVMIKVKT